MNADAVVARDLAVGYDGTPTVSAIDLSLGAGGLLALMGTNGSGKSTLLRTIAGLLVPVRGELSVLGGRPGAAAARVAYLPQHPASNLTLPLRAEDVVAMGRFPHLGLLGRVGPEDRDAVASAMARTGVDRFARRPLRELSGGQQQRTHLAAVLARRADLLLLDEPTAGLDAPGREAVAEAIDAERARGAAVVVATHDLADAEHADVVMLLAHRVVAVGAPASVLTDANLRECYGFTDRH